LDLHQITDHLAQVERALRRRGPDAVAGLARVTDLAGRRSEVIHRLEALRHQKNEANQAMSKLPKDSGEFRERRDALKEIAREAKTLEDEERAIEKELTEALSGIPNVPSDETPDGTGTEANPCVRTWGEAPKFDFTPRDHVAIGEGLGILDFARAAKTSGARFVVLRGAGAALERALMMFMLDLHTREHGYLEVWPPALVRAEALRGTGQLPKFAADLFRVEPGGDAAGVPDREDLYLIPTAEVPVTNLHADEILDADRLPLKYVAYTPCFRSEAGNYGKDTRGMIRQHQFDKVELVRFEEPEHAPRALLELTSHAEAVLARLGLHHRVVELCAGDLGFSARRCFDLEVWLPGQDAYREISSCSWFGDFQARRAKIRVRAPGGKPRLLHTLNGSGVAIGRTLVAILEQGQQADGSVRLPEALAPYMGGIDVLRP
jgi:seryl-tRNA synthetase